LKTNIQSIREKEDWRSIQENMSHHETHFESSGDEEHNKEMRTSDEHLSEERKQMRKMKRKKSKRSKPKKLEHRWRFWHEKPMNDADWQQAINPNNNDNLKEICQFDTIQDFWLCFNSLPSVYGLELKHSFHLMKKVEKEDKSIDSIRPLWEDPENINGGEWIFRVDKKYAEDVWRELILAIIGEQYSDYLKVEGDDICGLSVSTRPVDYVFQLWHRVYDEKEKEILLERTKQILNEICNVQIKTPYYKIHRQS
jgi:hypothetical protein